MNKKETNTIDKLLSEYSVMTKSWAVASAKLHEISRIAADSGHVTHQEVIKILELSDSQALKNEAEYGEKLFELAASKLSYSDKHD